MRENSHNPSLFDFLLEFTAIGEFARFAGNAWSWSIERRAASPRPILLIPGFLVGDVTLYPFAQWLRSHGHQVFFSGIIANTDCPRRAVQRLEQLLEGLHSRYGEKLVVIGHSLGGIYARELARRLPQCVRQVILLASPVHEPGNHSNPFIKMLAKFTMHLNESAYGCSGEVGDLCGVHSTTPPDVSEAIIYSKSDGVVDWRTCIESGPNVHCFEVDSTHCGLPYHPRTLRIVSQLIEHDDSVAPLRLVPRPAAEHGPSKAS